MYVLNLKKGHSFFPENIFLRQKKKHKPELFLNVRNALDAVYVQDATDNSRYNAEPFRVNDHTANAAEVYLGLPTSFNLGLKVNF